MIDHLFRHESGRMVATLTRIFGVHNLELAEDVVQDTLLKACRQWAFSGIPANPSAWLFRVAKNNVLDVVRRERYKKEYASHVSQLLKSEYTAAATIKELFLENEIRDDQLRMMFACCHPSLPPEGQVALTLKTLCGFSVAEISRAFLSNEETITKRLYRAKEKFRTLENGFEIPSGNELNERLDRVLSCIYLLFNEGYNSTQHNELIRKDVIQEALRLAFLLTENPQTDRPEVHALLALMLFHTARSQGRMNENHEIVLLAEQDRSKWNGTMISAALEHLDLSSNGDRLTAFHLEAGIAFHHAVAADYASTDWNSILELYDQLYAMNPSPVIALNRAVIVAEIQGPQEGLKTIGKIREKEELEQFYLYHAALGDLYLRLHQHEKAYTAFEKALSLTSSVAEINLLKKKMAACSY